MIFIRPWLLLLVFIPFLFQLWNRQQTQKTPWTKWVDKKLLPALLVQHNNKQQKVWKPTLWILWILLTIAASGPAFQKIPVPVSNALPNTVIIFDLGPSMQGQTLATAKIKLHDMLTALKGNRVGLVLYADKGYTALPLTQDRGLLRSLIPTLDNSVLPSKGQNLSKAFDQANQLIQQTGGKGRIIYFTAGGVNANNVRTSHPVGVLGLGDDRAISRSIKNLGTYHFRTTDATDILTLLKSTTPAQTISFDDGVKTDEWADLGGILTLILIPFIAFTFRKGFLFLLMLGVFLPANAAFLKRSDQIDYTQQMQAISAYRQSDYTSALKGFQNHPYNLGNTLAQSGKIQEAIQSYAKAIQQNPKDEDAIFNKEYLEKQLQQQQNQNNNQDQNQDKNQNQQQQNDSQNNQNESDQNQDQSEQQSNDSSNQQNEQDQQQAQPESEEQNENNSASPEQEQEQPESETNESTEQEPTEINEQDREQSSFDQEGQQVLNRLRQDPYRVLRYRLLQQQGKNR